MQLPRLTKSIFLDQFLFMQLVGLLMGFAFPHFLLLYGFESNQVLTTQFYIVSLVAGQLVGLISFFLISMVIRPHLKLLSSKMQHIAEGLNNKQFEAIEAECNDEICQIEVSSNDEIGVSAKAYNQLLDALLKSHEVETVFNKFSIVMSENLDLEKLSSKTLSLLIDSTNFEAAAILISKKGELTVAASEGIMSADTLVKHDVVLKSVKDTLSTKLTLPKNINLDGVLTQFQPSEVFIKPIEFKGVSLGVLIAATGAELADERTELLAKLFSRSIGLAINNAIIHSKFQKLAAIDGLTSIYNRRFGMERLKEDFVRAVRDGNNMSVAMVDIDTFKSVNDTYGHLVGDKAIKLVADIITEALREGDIVIRYGGDEFLMILHGASIKNAIKICERIRHQVRDSIIQECERQIRLTVSIGLVSFPEVSAKTEIDLVHKADKALYQAKENGRDQVGLLSPEAMTEV